MRVFMQTLPHGGTPPAFYQLILQEDLLGGWTLIRQWGAMGKRGVHRREHFDDHHSAQEALIERRDNQLSKGFQIMFVHNQTRSEMT